VTGPLLPALAVLAVGTLALRLAGPAVLRGAEPPAWLRLAAIGAVAGMVVLGAAGGGGGIVVDARLVGLAVAVAALLARLPFAAVIGLAVAATALVRLLA
jgi:hypothetical protein